MRDLPVFKPLSSVYGALASRAGLPISLPSSVGELESALTALEEDFPQQVRECRDAFAREGGDRALLKATGREAVSARPGTGAAAKGRAQHRGDLEIGPSELVARMGYLPESLASDVAARAEARGGIAFANVMVRPGVSVPMVAEPGDHESLVFARFARARREAMEPYLSAQASKPPLRGQDLIDRIQSKGRGYDSFVLGALAVLEHPAEIDEVVRMFVGQNGDGYLMKTNLAQAIEDGFVVPGTEKFWGEALEQHFRRSGQTIGPFRFNWRSPKDGSELPRALEIWSELARESPPGSERRMRALTRMMGAIFAAGQALKHDQGVSAGAAAALFLPKASAQGGVLPFDLSILMYPQYDVDLRLQSASEYQPRPRNAWKDRSLQRLELEVYRPYPEYVDVVADVAERTLGDWFKAHNGASAYDLGDEIKRVAQAVFESECGPTAILPAAQKGREGLDALRADLQEEVKRTTVQNAQKAYEALAKDSLKDGPVFRSLKRWAARLDTPPLDELRLRA
jgi:hypothetical protein